MELAIFERLLQAEGQALLAELAERDLRDATLLSEIERLRSRYDPAFVRAAIETSQLRRRAAAKFPQAERMYFVREALEQATAAPVAHYRANRLLAALGPESHVLDVCCGIGGDALALAAAGARVTAIDYDPLRAAMARANAEALGLGERVTVLCADATQVALPPADALFCDPARRADGKRLFEAEQYQPPLSWVLGLSARYKVLGIKLAPGIDYDALLQAEQRQIECISLGGDLKEALLWCGPLADSSRRATLLPENVSLTAAVTAPQIAQAEPGAYLYEPDPAVIRAHLVAELAQQIGAWQLDPTIAYLSSDQAIATPFARVWPVLEWQPFNLKKLRARLRALDAGSVTVKKRGSPLDTDQLARQLSSNGSRELVVVLTLLQNKPFALICDPPLQPSAI
jgi:Predicted O-methyltransferase